MHPDFTYSDDLATSRVVLEILRLLRPFRAAGIKKIRLGREGDGGYVLLDDFHKIATAYSLGVGGDVSFDLDLADRGITVYQFDQTIEALPAEHERFRWKKQGIGDINPQMKLAPFHVLMRENGDGVDGPDLLLKCDIEGFEWRMLETAPEGLLRRFRQIVIEVHSFAHIQDPEYAPIVLAGVRALTKDHAVIHVHGNNNAAYCIVGGVPVPNSLELTLARRNAYLLTPSNETFPTELDRPCWPHRTDYFLGSFVY